MASPTPVFPEVGSTIVPPGRSFPSRSAASISGRPIRSFTEPPGFRYSSFARSVGSTSAPSLSRRTIGVAPTRSSTVGYSGGIDRKLRAADKENDGGRDRKERAEELGSARGARGDLPARLLVLPARRGRDRGRRRAGRRRGARRLRRRGAWAGALPGRGAARGPGVARGRQRRQAPARPGEPYG